MINKWIILCLILRVAKAQRWEPFPLCLSCISQALLDAPGIGFDLSASYGTIAVRLNNGSILDVEKVEGDEDYKALMSRLMRSPETTNISQISASDDNSASTQSATVQVELDSDIDVLSRFITILRATTEQRIGTTVSLGVATHPSLPNLQRNTLLKAFNQANMTHLESYKVITRLDSIHHVVAGFAASGYGVCEHWTDSRVCENEDQELPVKQVLTIDFSDDSLVVSNTRLVGPHATREPQEIAHWDLGFDRWRKDPEDDKFWSRVRQAIEDTPVSYQTPDLLLLLGDAVSNQQFQDVVQQALELMNLAFLYDNWRRSQQNPIYLAARGAAEIAKVWQGSEWNCLQRDFCTDDRPRDDGNGVTLREMYDKRAQWNESCMIGNCPWDGYYHGEL